MSDPNNFLVKHFGPGYLAGITGWHDPSRWGYARLAVLVLPYLHFVAVLHAATLRRVDWQWCGVW